MKSDWTNPSDVMRWVLQGNLVHCSNCAHQVKPVPGGAECALHHEMQWTDPRLPHSDGYYCCLDWKSRDHG